MRKKQIDVALRCGIIKIIKHSSEVIVLGEHSNKEDVQVETPIGRRSMMMVVQIFSLSCQRAGYAGTSKNSTLDRKGRRQVPECEVAVSHEYCVVDGVGRESYGMLCYVTRDVTL